MTSSVTSKKAQPSWEPLWEEENQALMLHNIRSLSVIAMTLVPMCSLLDYFAYPALWLQFLYVRLAVSAFEIVLLIASHYEIGKRHYRILVLMVPLVPAMSIAWMMYSSGDPASPYYAGLTLCLMGLGLLFQWSLVESLVAVAITFVLYLSATVPLLLRPTTPEYNFGEFVNNAIFLFSNSVVIVTGSLVHQRIRRNEFISRVSLAQNRKELEHKNLQLVEMDRMKSDFFSNITHELRTPLTLMIAPLQRLQRLSAPEGGGEGSKFAGELGGIYQNALRLLKLINDLLDLASADAGRLNLVQQRFSLKLFSNRLLQSVGNVAEHGGVAAIEEYESGIDLVEADQEKLEKALINLLFNAVKFTPAGGSVTLRTVLNKHELWFEVRDTGVGISAKNLPFIFDRFWQADSSVTRKHPGTGLGLALVKEMAEKMNGSVEAESVLGKGTTVRMRLPYSKVGDVAVLEGANVSEGATEETEVVESEEVGLTNDGVPQADLKHGSASAAWIHSVYREAEMVQPKDSPLAADATAAFVSYSESEDQDRSQLPLLLLVDDEPGMLQFMRLELEPHYRIIEADDGQAALEALEVHRPDLIIADYMMPQVDGLTLCRKLRLKEEFRMLPIMLVTARSDEEVRLTALRNGANDVLIKPFSLTEFHTRILNLVQNGKLQTEIERQNKELVQTLRELKAAEEDLVRSEKMASLGILTGGILHEINNPLNFARSALYILDRRMKKMPELMGGEIQEVVADVGEGISRITSIVSDLRTFCHPGTEMASVCLVVEPLQSALRILSGPLKNGNVKVHESVSPELSVYGDRNQLTMLLMNLLKNSVDALSESPPEQDQESQIWISARQDMQEMELKIRDNGPGMPTAELTKIFDPFFTTKAPGEGTGLGLSICYRIVAAHGGTIRAHSEPGTGMEFTIRLRMAVGGEDTRSVIKPMLAA